jgi:flagellar biosynthesis anti-sigma factor FlgM
MRIDSTNNNRIAADAAAANQTKQAAGNASKIAGDDKAELSTDGARVNSLTAQLNQLPEVRSEKITELQKAIRQGTYDVTPEQTADAIIADVQGRLAA